jgi:hypothetical protein
MALSFTDDSFALLHSWFCWAKEASIQLQGFWFLLLVVDYFTTSNRSQQSGSKQDEGEKKGNRCTTNLTWNLPSIGRLAVLCSSN